MKLHILVRISLLLALSNFLSGKKLYNILFLHGYRCNDKFVDGNLVKFIHLSERFTLHQPHEISNSKVNLACLHVRKRCILYSLNLILKITVELHIQGIVFVDLAIISDKLRKFELRLYHSCTRAKKPCLGPT